MNTSADNWYFDVCSKLKPKVAAGTRSVQATTIHLSTPNDGKVTRERRLLRQCVPFDHPSVPMSSWYLAGASVP